MCSTNGIPRRLKPTLQSMVRCSQAKHQACSMTTSPLTISDESDPGERSFATIGTGTKGYVLVVIYTYRGDKIRI